MPPHETGDGKYKILRRLAVGGMAEIYLAEAANIHGFRKKVVIKRMLPQYTGEQSYVDMFLDEARLVARLNHPSVVQVFDIGEDAEGVFFTMEYVEGRDLSEILGTCYRANRLLTFSEVLAIAIPAAEGLHHAHEACDDSGELINLIHRDVSPSNVIVTNAGRVKLLDFGVAKSKSQSRETTGVSLKGKFGYMAPEQCEGLVIDRRCDIYSFGVVLWELFTGKRLHAGGNEPAVLVKIMTVDPPAPSSIRPDLPPELDAICLKALARNRDERYSTLQELLVDIDTFMTKSGTVVSSRTLSSMLQEVFTDDRDTMPVDVAKLVNASAPSPGMSNPAMSNPATPNPATPNPAPPNPATPNPSAPNAFGPSEEALITRPNVQTQVHSPSPGSSGGHQNHPGSNSTGPQPILSPPQGGYGAPLGHAPSSANVTPEHGYARLAPGSQFEQGSEVVVVPMKSRRGVIAAIVGAVVVLSAGIYWSSTMDSSAAAEPETIEGAVDDDTSETQPAAVVPDEPDEVKTPEQIAAEEKAAEEAAVEAKLAADQAAADQAAADEAAAKQKVADDEAVAKQKVADDEAAAKQKVADDQAAAKLAADQAAAVKKVVAAQLAAEKAAKKAAKKLAADEAAAAKKAAAEAKAAERKAAAEERKAAAAAARKDKNKKNPKDKKKPKWDPNSPFAPQ